MCHQFNIQQLYVLPHTVYLCVLCGSQNKQLLFSYTAYMTGFCDRQVCLLRSTDWVFIRNSANPRVALLFIIPISHYL